MGNDLLITTSNLPLLRRFTLGGPAFFENMLEDLNLLQQRTTDNFPPCNIIELDKGKHRVEIALAGFDPKNIKITVENGLLTVSTTSEEIDEHDTQNYTWRGIARRAFTRQFRLMEYGTVISAKFTNGLLSIDTEQVLPDALKPKEIKIECIS